MASNAARRLAIVAPPIALAVLAAIHPAVAEEDLQRWMVIHVLQIPLAVGLGISVILLVEGTPGIAATLTRAATLPWIAAFAAFDALAGLADGIVVGVDAEHPGTDAALADVSAKLTGGVLIDVMGWIAIGGAAIAGLSLVVSMRTADRSVIGAALVAAGALVWTVVHPLIGAPALLVFALGAWLVDASCGSRPPARPMPSSGEQELRAPEVGSVSTQDSTSAGKRL